MLPNGPVFFWIIVSTDTEGRSVTPPNFRSSGTMGDDQEDDVLEDGKPLGMPKRLLAAGGTVADIDDAVRVITKPDAR